MKDLTTIQGLVAVGAATAAAAALVIAVVLAVMLRRLRRAQTTILGQHQPRDLVEHAHMLQAAHEQTRRLVESLTQRFESFAESTGSRLDGAISHAAVIRYDAYGEMSGRQSSSVALLDEGASGVVLSSILHRDQARLYAKELRDGHSEIELSPEEQEVVASALASRAGRQGDAAVQQSIG